MNERLAYIGKLAFMSLFSFSKIILLGFVSTSLFGVLAFFIVLTENSPGQSAHVSADPFLFTIIFIRPLACLLYVLTIFLSPYLVLVIATKYSYSKIAHRIITDKSERYLDPLLDKVLTKFKSNSESAGHAHNPKVIKKELIRILRNENESRWLKAVIGLSLKQIDFHDVDFNKDNFSFTEVLKMKVIQAIHTISKPSRKYFWLLILTQWLFLLIIWLVPI